MKFCWTSLFVFLILFAAACSDDSSITLCGCEPDEYCVQDECHATDGTVRPAPVPQSGKANAE